MIAASREKRHEERINYVGIAEQTVDEQTYLTFERASDVKHELIGGDLYLMTGASREHNLIVFNLAATLGAQLKNRPYEAYANDMRVKVRGSNYTYPDLVATCEPPEFEDAYVDTLLSPALLIEVLSPSTEQYDRGKKFEAYRTLHSLQEYVLIAQERPYIEWYVRQSEMTWIFSEVSGLDASVTLRSIGCKLLLADIYEKVLGKNDFD